MSIDAETALEEAMKTLHAAGCQGSARCSRHSEWSARVRRGLVERIESSDSASLQVTAYGAGNRIGSASSTELTPASARTVAAHAAELCAWSDADTWRGLPPSEECGVSGGDLRTEDVTYNSSSQEELVHAQLLEQVSTAEAAAYSVDARISNSHRCSAHAVRSLSWLRSSAGVAVHRRGTHFGFNAQVVAQLPSGERQNGGWSTSSRQRHGLRSAQDVGGEAGRRAVAGFGWKRIPSGPCPVLLRRETASQLLGVIAQAVNGSQVYRGGTFLAGKLGQVIASMSLGVHDAPLLPGHLGSRGCDAEGVRSREVSIIEEGRLASFLVDGYAARRIGHPYTGHDGGVSNLFLRPGQASFDDLLKQLHRGLLVTEFQGFGVDLASGSFSKGISGFWVEDDRISHPVQEVTIAGNLASLLLGIRAIGNDPLEQSRVSSPSLLIDGFTVGGL